MRERKSVEENPTNTLRRSPRFLRRSQTTVENTRTPDLAPRKTRVRHSFSPLLGSSIAEPRKRGNVVPQKDGGKCAKSKTLTKSEKGSGRSARLESGPNLSCPDLQKRYVIEKRVTRSSIQRRNFAADQVNGTGSEVASDERAIVLSKERNTKASNNAEILGSCTQNATEKRVTRSSIRRSKFVNIEAIDLDSDEYLGDRIRVSPEQGNTVKRIARSSGKGNVALLDKQTNNVSRDRKSGVLSLEERKPAGDDELSKPDKRRREVKESRIVKANGHENCKRKVQVGEKRKRSQIEGEAEVVQGWTKEQELALQRAYFTAKPTPQFWKKVARMVPGKSAGECFDRIQSDHLTPSQRPARSRANKKKTSPVSFSASKLLTPDGGKTKRLRPSRRNTLAAQKTVRQLLQKQQKEDNDHQADFFAVLEPTISPFVKFQAGSPFSSPPPKQGSGILTRCREMSLSANKKQRSRLHSSSNAAFVSPPVLKQVKNKALHEKYIDQLHCRDAKRKAQSLRKAKFMQDQDDSNAPSHLEVNTVKFAKDALVFEAQDAIIQIRSLQLSTNDDDNGDDDDDISRSDEDEI